MSQEAEESVQLSPGKQNKASQCYFWYPHPAVWSSWGPSESWPEASVSIPGVLHMCCWVGYRAGVG